MVLLVVTASVVLQLSRRAEPKAAPVSIGGAAAVFAFLLVEYQLLGQPAALATLHETPSIETAWWYFALMLASQIGLLIGLRAGSTMTMSRPSVLAAVIAYLVGAILLVTGLAYSAAPIWLAIAQASAVLLLSAALNVTPRPVGAAGKLTGTVQLVWWLLIVLHAFAGKWPFLPSVLRPMLQDRGTIYLLLSFATDDTNEWIDHSQSRSSYRSVTVSWSDTISRYVIRG